MHVLKDDMKRTNAELESTTDKLGEDASTGEANPTPHQFQLRLRLLMLSYLWHLHYVANLTKIDANLAKFDVEDIHEEPPMA